MRWRDGDSAETRPDIEGARRDLARAKRRRPDVDALVAALAREKQLNNFTANLTIVFRGGRP
jgi:predicted nucleic acid-binding protein